MTRAHFRLWLLLLVCVALLPVALAAWALTTRHTADNLQRRACELVSVAVQDASGMAEQWYVDAGKVITTCGMVGGDKIARYKACQARRFSDNTIDCEALP